MSGTTAVGGSQRFVIVTVCTGNICRSPIAEQHLRAQLVGIPSVVLESAGTGARDGDRMPEQAIRLAQQYGADPAEHRARYLQESHLRGADLVLAMAREHRRDAVALFPKANRYTFTVREFARLAASVPQAVFDEIAASDMQDPAERMRAAVRAVAGQRGQIPAPLDAADDDVVDPYRRDDDVFQESGRQLIPATTTVGQYLRAAASLQRMDIA